MTISGISVLVHELSHAYDNQLGVNVPTRPNEKHSPINEKNAAYKADLYRQAFGEKLRREYIHD